MHNIVPKDGLTVAQEKRRILEELAYQLKAAERTTLKFDAIIDLMSEGPVKDVYLKVQDQLVAERLTAIAKLTFAHFLAPATASVQVVAAE